MGNIMTSCVEITNYEDINKAGFDVMRNIQQLNEINLVFNPLDLFLSMSCLAEALEDDYYSQLQHLFKFGNDNVLRYDELQKLQKYSNQAYLKKMNFFVFEKKLKIKKNFKKIVKSKYKIEFEEVNLEKETESGYRTLQGYAKARGFHLPLKNNFRSYFSINCTNFNTRWKEGFNEHKNFKGKFTCDDEIIINCVFMKGGKKCGVLKDEKQVYISIPMSKEGQAFVISLSEENENYFPLENLKLEKILESTTTSPIKVKLSMPKFDCFSQVELREPLKSQNIEKIFEKGSGRGTKFLTDKALQLEDVQQYGRIVVGEEGDIGENLNENCRMKIVINRPFSYFLVDYVNELVLLSGILRYPDEENFF